MVDGFLFLGLGIRVLGFGFLGFKIFKFRVYSIYGLVF